MMDLKTGLLVTALTFSVPLALPRRQEEKKTAVLRQEESEDYFSRWLRADVKYIITEEERTVFEKLTTDEEKEKFIEQFWYRRDPEVRTAVNEFKEEHYRRIAYANEHFEAGLPGWKTDRGRIYIAYGPPDEIESHPSGGRYTRPLYEGGGQTETFPFEIWRYRHIEGLGPNVILEFVDTAFSGLYRLTHDPGEKDALTTIPGYGQTDMEKLGLAARAERVNASGQVPRLHPSSPYRMVDSPFDRYERYSQVLKAPVVKYKDLKEIVTVNVTFNDLPFQVREDYFKLNDEQILVAVTLEVENKYLTFQREEDLHKAGVGVYGMITSITNQIVAEFEDDLSTFFNDIHREKGLAARSVYQKILPLDRKMRYKVDLVVKDLISGKTGVTRRAIVSPPFDREKLSASSLLLSNHIRELPEVPKDNQRFVLGNVWIRPSVREEFPLDQSLGVYLQVYNVALDQTTLVPALRITYRVLRDASTVLELIDQSGEAVQFHSDRRVVLVKQVPVSTFPEGAYTIEVEVHDQIKGEKVTASTHFRLVENKQR